MNYSKMNQLIFLSTSIFESKNEENLNVFPLSLAYEVNIHLNESLVELLNLWHHFELMYLVFPKKKGFRITVQPCGILYVM